MKRADSTPPCPHLARSLTRVLVLTTLLLTGATSSHLPPSLWVRDDGEGELLFLLLFPLLVVLAQWGLNLSPPFPRLFLLFFLLLLAQAEAVTLLLIFFILLVPAAMVGAFFSTF